MASLKSLYSSAVTANIPSDVLPPQPPVLGSITAYQDSGVTWGRSIVTLNWTAPTLNERIGGEHLGQSTGGADAFESDFDPIAASPAAEVYEVTGYTTSGGDTTLSGATAINDLTITVASATNFSVGDWIALETGTDKEYAKIASIDTLTFTLEERLRLRAWPATTTTVKEVDVTLLTITTDYTITLSTGAITLVSGQTTSGNEIFVQYSATLQDLQGYKLYRIPGNFPVSEPADHTTVSGHGSVVTVSTSIADTATSYQETLTAGENGETWTYYLFAYDDETSANHSIADAVFVETLPSLPDGLSKTVGDSQVVLSWTAFPGGSDANTDGVNVYRDDGATFEDSTCIKVNSTLVPKATTTFDDSVNNVTNRRPSGEVAYPVNGSTYSYKIESEDTTTAWTTGTKNQDSETGAANTTASKTAP